MKPFSESDMYEPIKKFFLALDYEVKGEVLGCDIVMTKGSELIIIEMKKSMNLSLIYQAISRQKATNQVYIAIPRPKSFASNEHKSALELVKRLELGLITVAMDSRFKIVQIHNFPPLAKKTKNPVRRAMIEKEAGGRSLDMNTGGTNGKKLMTAYRENAIKIACVLHVHGILSPAKLRNEFGCPKNTAAILRSNYYGWFEKVSTGLYALSPIGSEMIASDQFGEMVSFHLAAVKSGEN